MEERQSSAPHCLGVNGSSPEAPTGGVVQRDNEEYYRIENYTSMPPFLVSLTSPSDHWLFVSTTGGITAGRKNADHALFPYTTEDRVADSATTTGAVTIVLVQTDGEWVRWEPFSRALDGIYRVRRAVEKNATGNVITFVEQNIDLGLTFSQTWTSSPEYGVVRRCRLVTERNGPTQVRLLDGVRNTLPALTTAAFQASFSVLLDAYKRSELLPGSNLGVFGLSAVPTDTAEPSEALAATTWWQSGLRPEAILLSTTQLDSFRRSGSVEPEHDVKGQRGAYIVVAPVTLRDRAGVDWLFCGEVDQESADVAALDAEIRREAPAIGERVARSVAGATARLRHFLSRNDGIQATGDALTRMHHAANVTYNTMRGGYFAFGYEIPARDFRRFVRNRNTRVADESANLLNGLPDSIRMDELRRRVDLTGNPGLRRITLEYLPLTFSRRHGDPSRPWNAFSIENQHGDGSPRLAYQGNWRDIFQNWEALLLSSPLFVTNVIAKFLNATTIDGYNPYRVSDIGIDWEKPDPHSPWANIGYWGDHQIVYLLKLLELSERFLPGSLGSLLSERIFAFADVPYRIASFDEMLADPYATISFDGERDRAVIERERQIGSDGKLLHGPDGRVVHVTMMEKLVILALAKAANFVPDGGVWMNTQRPEWNDANNALVGKGVSVVTAAYLQRFADVMVALLEQTDGASLSEETAEWIDVTVTELRAAADGAPAGWSAETRLRFMRRCGEAASNFRERVFRNGLSGRTRQVDRATLGELFGLIGRMASAILEHNRRPDRLFHSYNTLVFARDDRDDVIGVSLLPLSEMLEGQVAALSATVVQPSEAEQTLAALRSSALYRADQHSYLLYPNRDLPGFVARNRLPADVAHTSVAVAKLLAAPTQRIITAGPDGTVHFHASCRNARLLRQACASYRASAGEAALTDREARELESLYEETFQHQYFTGRSGTFYGYEGLGSIYWHMVAKLLLATQEQAIRAHEAGDHPLAVKLRERYFDIRRGIGFNKSPAVYGAFPADPYSHTPFGGGARQPGMTGQVKEEIITRFAELGLLVEHGRIVFDPFLVAPEEFLGEPTTLRYVDVAGAERDLGVTPGSFAFTFCQTPVIVSRTDHAPGLVLTRRDGSTHETGRLVCPRDASAEVFAKSGEIVRIEVRFARNPV